MSQHLESVFPNLRGNLETRHYPPPESIQFFLKIEKFTPMILLFIMCSGTLFRWANTPVPAWLTTVQDNRLYVLGGIFLFKYLLNSAASTGAFEVSYNGVPIFSKLRSGKQPADALQVFKLCCLTWNSSLPFASCACVPGHSRFTAQRWSQWSWIITNVKFFCVLSVRKNALRNCIECL